MNPLLLAPVLFLQSAPAQSLCVWPCNGDADQGTYLRLSDGNSFWVRDPDFSSGDLSGEYVRVAVAVGDQTLEFGGTVSAGSYSAATGLSLTSILALTDDLEIVENGGAVRLAAGTELDLVIADDAFVAASFDGVPAEVDTTLPEADLELEGLITGTYEADDGVSFAGEFTHPEDIVFTGTNFVATFLDGGIVDEFRVENSEFSEITFNLDGTFDLQANSWSGSVDVEGTLEGAYENDGLYVDATVALSGDLEIIDGDTVLVVTRDQDVDLEITASTLQSVEFSDVSADVDVDFGDMDELKVNGKVNGQYTTASGFDLTGSELTLTEDFTYEADEVTATLSEGGSLDVDVQESEIRGAAFEGVHTRLDADSSWGGISAEGTADTGRINEDGLKLEGELTLVEPIAHSSDDIDFTVEGTGTAKVTESTLVKFEGTLDFEAEIEIKNQTVEVSGSVDAKYSEEDGEAKLEGDVRRSDTGDEISVKVTLDEDGDTTIKVKVKDKRH